MKTRVQAPKARKVNSHPIKSDTNINFSSSFNEFNFRNEEYRYRGTDRADFQTLELSDFLVEVKNEITKNSVCSEIHSIISGKTRANSSSGTDEISPFSIATRKIQRCENPFSKNFKQNEMKTEWENECLKEIEDYDCLFSTSLFKRISEDN